VFAEREECQLKTDIGQIKRSGSLLKHLSIREINNVTCYRKGGKEGGYIGGGDYVIPNAEGFSTVAPGVDLD